MKYHKRAATFILALLLVIAIFPIPQAQASGTASDIVSIASSQVGTKGGTKYRSWFYGRDNSNPWCAIFVAWCAEQAGIPTSVIPRSAAVSGIKSGVIAGGGQVVSSPQAGDLVLYWDNDEGRYAHVGIMTGTQTSVQGNLGGQVKSVSKPTDYKLSRNRTNYRVEYIRPAYGGSSSSGQTNTGVQNISVSVTTSDAREITDTSAVLYGSVAASGARATEVGMYLGTTASNMTKLGSDPVNSYSPNMWYSTVKYGRVLTPNTTYYYRAYAIVNGKTYYGDTAIFSTTGNTRTASVTLNKDTLTIQDNVCDFLTATTNPAGQTVSWSSSNTSVATVENGIITGLKAGTTTITASITYNGKVYTDTCRVTVEAANGITLSETSVSMKDGETLQLVAHTTPSNRTVYWTSSNTDVAVVSTDGLVAARNAGQTTITAYFNYGTDTYTTTCAVTVTPSTETPSVSIPTDSITIADNAYDVLQACTIPNNRSVTWTSSDTSIVTVRNGTVTAVSPGTAIITASMTYNGATYSDTCFVTVERIREDLVAPVLSVSKTQLIAGESFTASWTKSASDAVYYTNVSGNLADGSVYMEMSRDTTGFSSTLGADWEPGTYQLHVVARNDYGQIKSNVVTIKVIADPTVTPDPANSTLQIASLKLPSGDIKDGDKISLSGTVRSNYAINKVKITVYDTKSGACIYSQSHSGDGTSMMSISRLLASAVKAANYASSFSINIEASDISGKSVMSGGTFTVVS